MKKTIISIFIAIFTIAPCFNLFSACSYLQNGDDKIAVVTTIFPEYDWTMNVLGKRASEAETTLLISSGADLHNFQPTVSDIAKISTCDLFVYVGGESDDWVDDALKNATNENMIVINLLETLGEKAKEEEITEGMETEEEESEDDQTEYDEHVWLSLKNARIFVNEIASALAKIDEPNSLLYAENAAAYNAELSALDKKYEGSIAESNKKTVLFGDRFPFRYLVDDYGLTYYAAFVGCSAETEASFKTIIFLANKVNELGLAAILKIENSDGKIAQTVKENTTAKNQKILTMDSLQSATEKEYENGRTYLKVMENNLAVLIEALK
ncbi:MAG: zinc ABC transporter substrate-binding protein [Clostridia bacterium]|nr:zinc ABC transporter substrate-binding protein [Clostridia bacterium]